MLASLFLVILNVNPLLHTHPQRKSFGNHHALELPLLCLWFAHNHKASSPSLLCQGLFSDAWFCVQVGRTLSKVQQAFSWAYGEEIKPFKPPLSDAEFHSYLNGQGQLSRPEELRLRIYHGGVEPSLRKVQHTCFKSHVLNKQGRVFNSIHIRCVYLDSACKTGNSHVLARNRLSVGALRLLYMSLS